MTSGFKCCLSLKTYKGFCFAVEHVEHCPVWGFSVYSHHSSGFLHRGKVRTENLFSAFWFRYFEVGSSNPDSGDSHPSNGLEGDKTWQNMSSLKPNSIFQNRIELFSKVCVWGGGCQRFLRESGKLDKAKMLGNGGGIANQS